MNLTNDSNLLSLLDILDFIQYKASTSICVLGILGNLLAVTVFASNHRLRRSTCAAYLICLSIYDTVYLICQFVFNLHVNGLVNFTNHFTCGLLVFFFHTSSCLSPLCVCAFTVERFVVVRYPLKRASICTLSNARKILFLMLPYPIIIFTILATAEEAHEDTCTLKKDEASLLINAVVQVIDIFVSCLIPMILIFSLNATIARDLLRAGKQQMAMIESSSGSSVRERNAREEASRKKERSITNMLFIVSMTFALFNLPSYIVRIKAQYVLVVARDTSSWTVYDEIAEKIGHVLYIANFAIDFLIYSASSGNFRSATRDLLKKSICWRKVRRSRSAARRSTISGRTTQTELNETGSIKKGSEKRVTVAQDGV